MKTGIRTGDWCNRKRRYEIPYVNGKRHGLAKWWYSNGKRRYEIPHTNGQKHGIEKWWYSNGQREQEAPYVNGQRHGLQKWWHNDGSLGILIKLNQDQRVWRIYFPSKEQLPGDAEIELFFHLIPELS